MNFKIFIQEVVAVKKLRWWTRFFKSPSIDITTDKEFVVRTLYSSAIGKAISIHYRIMVPKGMLVKYIETSTGEINLDQVTGDVDIKASTGAIQISKVIGSVKVVTGTGKIHADQVTWDVDVKASAGDIEIHQVNGFVKAETSSGKIHITAIGGLDGARTDTGKIFVEVPAIRDNLEIKSGTGSITVFLSPDIAGELEAGTSNGKITYIDLPLTVRETSKTKLTGRLGEAARPPEGRINIKTSTGAITLKKLGK
jgi:DUF4097 and DUF4098 domain-containing protein YvlB